MESLFANTAGILLFVFLFRFLREGRCKMLACKSKESFDLERVDVCPFFSFICKQFLCFV